MVRPAGAPLEPVDLSDLPEPTWGSLLRRGLPMFAVEGFLPLLVFYGTLQATGLAPAIVASTAACALIVVWQLRRGHDVGIAVATLVFLLIQAGVGLAAHSATVYLAQPVVLSALWGLAYLGSVAVGRPLIGVFAERLVPVPAGLPRERAVPARVRHAVARLGLLLPRARRPAARVAPDLGDRRLRARLGRDRDAGPAWRSSSGGSGTRGAPSAVSRRSRLREESEPKPRAGGRGFGSCDASTGHAGD